MIYEFETQDGKRVEIEYPIGQAPSPEDGWFTDFGSGKVVRRVISVPGALKVRPNVHFQAVSFRPGTPGAKHYAPDGAPRFASRSEAVEFAHRRGQRYDGE